MAVNYIGKLPAQVECILHTGIHALASGRRMHVRGIAAQDDVPAPVHVADNLPDDPA